MEKQFDQWNEDKKRFEKNLAEVYFYEREIWWCALGVNIGFEQDGRGDKFLRPILILRKWSDRVFLGIPLTKTKKTGKYYFPLTTWGVRDIKSTLILSQVRLLDSNRLVDKIGMVKREEFVEIKNAVKRLIS